MSVSIVWQLFDWSLHLECWRAIGWAASGSDHLDIVGRVESNLTAAQLSFTPALLVLVTELQQLLTWNKHNRKSDVCMKWCFSTLNESIHDRGVKTTWFRPSWAEQLQTLLLWSHHAPLAWCPFRHSLGSTTCRLNLCNPLIWLVKWCTLGLLGTEL